MSTVESNSTDRSEQRHVGANAVSNVLRQARYWIVTIPRGDWTPGLVPGSQWVKGQPELGETGYAHWQFVVSFSAKKTMRQVKSLFESSAHVEPTRSAAAEAYCCKEATRDGEPFEFGSRAINRNSTADWDRVKQLAISGTLDQIPADIFVRHYRTLRAIASDYSRPVGIEKQVYVFYGPTGTGKSRRAWNEAGSDAYCKDPRSKFWCGYSGQEHVVVDEFRGGIDVSHLLRWFDRYPVNVELKGSSIPLSATTVWITSNLHPNEWYPELDRATYGALDRRIEIILME